MRHHSLRAERGASAVFVSLLMLGLVALVAFAVDVGSILVERRAMQNAADASAMAGAQAICVGTPGNAFARAQYYALTEGGAQMADIVVGADTVSVTAHSTVTTYFARLLGVETVDVSASATAICDQIYTGAGFWPVAFDKLTWNTIAVGSDFYVWDDDKVGDDLCDKCKCEDVIGSSASVAPGHRGWLRFPDTPAGYANPGSCGGNCGAAALKCYVENDYYGPIHEGQCVPGEPGVDASALDAAESREGDELYILLWDSGSCGAGNTIGDCPGTPYYIVGFGRIELVEVHTKLTVPPRSGYKQGDCPKNVKAMQATKLSGVEDLDTLTEGKVRLVN